MTEQSEIYHLVAEPDLWAAIEGDAYAPASLADEGFIHCTGERDTLPVLADDCFASATGPMLVLAIAVDRLAAECRFEPPAPVPGAGTAHLQEGLLFPHIYGPLNLDAVTAVGVLGRGDEGYTMPGAWEPGEAFLARGA